MIIVTGAAGVVGQAMIQRLVSGGLDVAALDLAASIPPVGQRMDLPNIDLTDPTATTAAFDRVASMSAGIVGLANIAGGFKWETLESGSVDGWQRMHQMNFLTTLNCCKAAIPHLRLTHGAIVNTSAMAAVRATAGMGAYAASKSSVARLTESLAAEHIDHGVRVNAVLPSLIDTPQNRHDLPEADFSRWVTPDELARVIHFLLSDDAAAVTGAGIPVNGRII